MTATTLAAAAKRLIDKNGRSGCSIIRPGDGAAADPATPWKKQALPDATVVASLKVAFISIHEMRGEGRRWGVKDLRFQELTPGTEIIGLIAHDSLGGATILTGDLVVAGADRYMVLTCDPIQPGDVTIAYQMELKN